MAKTARKNGKGTSGGTTDGKATELIEESQLGSAPEGFEDVFGARVAGWWALQPGNVIQGRLVDVFETKSQFKSFDGRDKRKVYKIEVTALPRPCYINVSDEDSDEPETRTANIGDLVGVDEKGYLRSLERVVVGQIVWIGYRGKEGPSAEFPQGRHLFVGPKAAPVKVHPVTGEVRS